MNEDAGEKALLHVLERLSERLGLKLLPFVAELRPQGVIPKADLVVGAQYLGSCRNAEVAKWDGANFWYLRTKFNSVFAESTVHPEDDNGYDVFVPLLQVTTDASCLGLLK